jgi:hypothetical protein
VRLADGSEHFGDEVISAADGHATLFHMLGGKYVSPEMAAAYERLPLYTPLVQVSFGVKRDMGRSTTGAGGRPDVPRLTTVQLEAPTRIGGTEVSFIVLNNYAFDATLSPRGTSALTVMFSMVGQWTTPAAGLPTAATDGSVAIQGLCAQDGKEFRTALPEAVAAPVAQPAAAARPADSRGAA